MTRKRIAGLLGIAAAAVTGVIIALFGGGEAVLESEFYDPFEVVFESALTDPFSSETVEVFETPMAHVFSEDGAVEFVQRFAVMPSPRDSSPFRIAALLPAARTAARVAKRNELRKSLADAVGAGDEAAAYIAARRLGLTPQMGWNRRLEHDGRFLLALGEYEQGNADFDVPGYPWKLVVVSNPDVPLPHRSILLLDVADEPDYAAWAVICGKLRPQHVVVGWGLTNNLDWRDTAAYAAYAVHVERLVRTVRLVSPDSFVWVTACVGPPSTMEWLKTVGQHGDGIALWGIHFFPALESVPRAKRTIAAVRGIVGDKPIAAAGFFGVKAWKVPARNQAKVRTMVARKMPQAIRVAKEAGYAGLWRMVGLIPDQIYEAVRP